EFSSTGSAGGGLTRLQSCRKNGGAGFRLTGRFALTHFTVPVLGVLSQVAVSTLGASGVTAVVLARSTSSTNVSTSRVTGAPVSAWQSQISFSIAIVLTTLPLATVSSSSWNAGPVCPVH